MRPARYPSSGNVSQPRTIGNHRSGSFGREATMRRSTVATALVAVFISYLGIPAPVKARGYDETDLVADVRPLTDKNGIVHNAKLLDRFLVNPWRALTTAAGPSHGHGLSRSPGGRETRPATSAPVVAAPAPPSNQIKVTIVRNGETKEYSVMRSDEGGRLNRVYSGAAPR